MGSKRFSSVKILRLLALTMVVIVLLLVFISFFFHQNRPAIDTGDYQRISGKVTYKNPDNETSTISLPGHINLLPYEEAMYYFRIPEGSASRDYLFVYVDNLDTTIYAGNQCIGNYQGAGNYKLGGAIPSEWYVMQFSKSYEYSNIYVKIKAGSGGYISDDEYAYFFRAPLIPFRINATISVRNFHSIIFTILAGFPTTTALSGTSFVTIDPVPTIAFSPMVTPGKMLTRAPIHAFFLMRISFVMIVRMFFGS